MAVEQVTDPVTYHGEGPVWHPGWGGLQFVDMLAGDVLRLRATAPSSAATSGRWPPRSGRGKAVAR
jgi:sugar lactone lactonase YvrE